MAYRPENPLIVQSNHELLLEVDNSRYEAARNELARFAELVKSPEHVHTYRITPLSLWNGASAGLTAQDVLETLEEFSKFDVPFGVQQSIQDTMRRYGLVKLVAPSGVRAGRAGARGRRGAGRGSGRDVDYLVLESADRSIIEEIAHHPRLRPYLVERLDATRLAVDARWRGHVKQVLVHIGYPVEDLAGYVEGAPLSIRLRATTRAGRPFGLRDYQQEAVRAFWMEGSERGGNGVIVLPCGAGKTIVGLGVMEKASTQTLILSTNVTAVRQWKAELLDKTTLEEDQIGEYTGEAKEIRPVTIATYQILTHRGPEDTDYPHFALFNSRDWGLVIYDEVHLLPADVFRITSEIQARRRLGLTATLVREDGREADVFSLIGPKRYDVPWRDLEKSQWIATAECFEIRVPLDESLRLSYAVAEDREKFRIASENPAKLPLVKALVEHHRDQQVLVIGQYLSQLEEVARLLEAPIITGRTPNAERESLYGDFKAGRLKTLVVSKVANFAVDLPDASVAIQISGTFGSRQEEAQRLGRILRPKAGDNVARFYSVITQDTSEQRFATKRQLFLTEQGYRYAIYTGDRAMSLLSAGQELSADGEAVSLSFSAAGSRSGRGRARA
ncbi:MAG: DEAD/DEAH box helicase [Limnochordaceae bacterium]|nr:DEAD/DEAH box helicase [Limnochordaceae bacterium]